MKNTKSQRLNDILGMITMATIIILIKLIIYSNEIDMKYS